MSEALALAALLSQPAAMSPCVFSVACSRSKSWGPIEWLSENLGGGSDGPDTGPKFGKNAKGRGFDDSGNFAGDRRVANKKG
mmetsp:Transcript_39400/g.103976  ORF Transcript_39400/g.103976 Transcript_39400/m.103976 type:complete len:82 (+) Transcript_39400:209-454(+)